MIDKDTYIPSKEDMHKLIKAFVSVHVDGELDGIGPNKPDAPFFERVAHADTIDEEDYIEMAERFYKYVNTQIPTIQHIAGYSPDTNWQAALMALHKLGMIAKQEREKTMKRKYQHTLMLYLNSYLLSGITPSKFLITMRMCWLL